MHLGSRLTVECDVVMEFISLFQDSHLPLWRREWKKVLPKCVLHHAAYHCRLCDAVIRCYSNDVLCVLLVSQDSTTKGAAPDLTFEAILEFVQRKYK